MSTLNRELTDNGYAVVPAVVDIDEVDRIGRFATDTLAATAGTRRLIELPWCRGPCRLFNAELTPVRFVAGPFASDPVHFVHQVD